VTDPSPEMTLHQDISEKTFRSSGAMQNILIRCHFLIRRVRHDNPVRRNLNRLAGEPLFRILPSGGSNTSKLQRLLTIDYDAGACLHFPHERTEGLLLFLIFEISCNLLS
jgi:hypothetical protein